MNPVTQDLFSVLRAVAQGKTAIEQMASQMRLWQQRHHLDTLQTTTTLTQFAAQLLHAVRIKQMAADSANELLSNLIVFSDFEIPPALYALQATLKLVAEHKPTTDQESAAPEQYVREQMGRMLAAMPERSQHKADQCRYSGRFGNLRHSA
jgi:hypothetical protein